MSPPWRSPGNDAPPGVSSSQEGSRWSARSWCWCRHLERTERTSVGGSRPRHTGCWGWCRRVPSSRAEPKVRRRSGCLVPGDVASAALAVTTIATAPMTSAGVSVRRTRRLSRIVRPTAQTPAQCSPCTTLALPESTRLSVLILGDRCECVSQYKCRYRRASWPNTTPLERVAAAGIVLDGDSSVCGGRVGVSRRSR